MEKIINSLLGKKYVGAAEKTLMGGAEFKESLKRRHRRKIPKVSINPVVAHPKPTLKVADGVASRSGQAFGLAGRKGFVSRAEVRGPGCKSWPRPANPKDSTLRGTFLLG